MSYAKAMKHRPHRLNVGHTFHSGMSSAPDIRAECCRCRGVCFVRSADDKDALGVTLRPCYGCVKEDAHA